MTLNEQMIAAGLSEHDRKLILEAMGYTDEDANKEGARAFFCTRKDIDKTSNSAE